MRYDDPDPHLRLRLHVRAGRAPETQASLAHWLESPLSDGRVWKWSIDTYRREVERYGGTEAVAICERIFEADSEWALRALERSQTTSARRVFGLMSVDSLLEDFGLSLEEKHSWAAATVASLGRELGHRDEFVRVSARMFRHDRARLESALGSEEMYSGR